MSHDELKAQVADLAIGALDAAEARRVEAHLAGCPECAAELRSLTGTAGVFRAMPPVPAPPAGEASLLDGARRAAERMAAAPRPAWRLPRWLLGLALGGAATAALVLSLRLGRAPPSRFDEGRDALEGVGAPARIEAAAQAGRAGEPVAPARPGPAAPPAAPPAERAEREAARAIAGPGRPTSPPLAPSPVTAPRPAPASAPAQGAAAKRRAAPEADGQAAQEVRPRVSKAIGVGDGEGAPGASGAPAVRPAATPARGTAGTDAAEMAPAREAETAAAPGVAASASAARAEAATAAPPPEVRSFASCEGEARRTLWRDAAGRLARRERQGRLGGVAYRVSEAFDADGRLSGARLEAGGRVASADRAGVAEGRLAGLVPGLTLALDAAGAEAALPRCGP